MDSDPLWSIAVGKWINDNGTVPFVDMFSWTVAGEQWYSNSWLFCWLMYLADQSIGYLGIALIVFIPCLVTAYFLYFMCMKYNDTGFSMLIFIAGIVALILLSITPRAYIYTFAFIAIIMYLIRFKRESNLIYTIPLIMLLWANMQSSITFGLAILVIEALVGSIFFKDRRLWPVVILSFLAVLINPYGFGFLTISYSGVMAPDTQWISEWRAPDFNELGIIILYLLLFLFGLFGASRLKDDINNKVFDREKIMILFWFWSALLLSLNTIRILHYAVLLLAPCFAAFSTKSSGDDRYLRHVALILALFLFVSSLFSALPLHSWELEPLTGKPISFVDYLQINPTLREKTSLIIPAEAVDYLKNKHAMTDRLFNSYVLGSYLILNNIEVFIDARTSVFTRHNVTEDYINITNMAIKPEVIIDKYDIKTFLLFKLEPLSFYLEVHPEWERKYEDDALVIFTRVNSE